MNDEYSNEELDPSTISISVFNSGSTWFPSMNGIRITHLPTGLFAECGEGRSQHRNKVHAMKLLRSMVHVYEQHQKEVKSLTNEIERWKNHHATEVRRARVLKERTDMPLERVSAYNQWAKDLEELQRLRERVAVVENALESAILTSQKLRPLEDYCEEWQTELAKMSSVLQKH